MNPWPQTKARLKLPTKGRTKEKQVKFLSNVNAKKNVNQEVWMGRVHETARLRNQKKVLEGRI